MFISIMLLLTAQMNLDLDKINEMYEKNIEEQLPSSLDNSLSDLVYYDPQLDRYIITNENVCGNIFPTLCGKELEDYLNTVSNTETVESIGVFLRNEIKPSDPELSTKFASYHNIQTLFKYGIKGYTVPDSYQELYQLSKLRMSETEITNIVNNDTFLKDPFLGVQFSKTYGAVFLLPHHGIHAQRNLWDEAKARGELPESMGFFSPYYWNCQTCIELKDVSEMSQTFRDNIKTRMAHEGITHPEIYDTVLIYKEPQTWNDYTYFTFNQLVNKVYTLALFGTPFNLNYIYLTYPGNPTKDYAQDSELPIDLPEIVYYRFNINKTIWMKSYSKFVNRHIETLLYKIIKAVYRDIQTIHSGTYESYFHKPKPDKITPEEYFECMTFLPWDRSPRDMQYGPGRYKYHLGPYASTKEVAADIIPYTYTYAEMIEIEEAQSLVEFTKIEYETNTRLNEAWNLELTYPPLAEIIKQKWGEEKALLKNFPWIYDYLFKGIPRDGDEDLPPLNSSYKPFGY